MTKSKLLTGEDRVTRCWWCGTSTDYVAYHDDEWGIPLTDNNRLFEKICLEGFQAGLSWLTILRKRVAFRKAFANFEIAKVARFTERKVERLLENALIVRHRGKIESTINNAQRAMDLIDEHGSLANFFWRYEPMRRNPPKTCVGKSAVSTQMSKDLKKLSWTFVGPTTCYSFMQAMGMVNDHQIGCEFREVAEQARCEMDVR
ncbi:MAG: DNA-3-methyladenine glycosylase I [Pirellulaceae bacterium]|jgi:DNA-3-methyladenine glycosylase I